MSPSIVNVKLYLDEKAQEALLNDLSKFPPFGPLPEAEIRLIECRLAGPMTFDIQSNNELDIRIRLDSHYKSTGEDGRGDK